VEIGDRECAFQNTQSTNTYQYSKLSVEWIFKTQADEEPSFGSLKLII